MQNDFPRERKSAGAGGDMTGFGEGLAPRDVQPCGKDRIRDRKQVLEETNWEIPVIESVSPIPNQKEDCQCHNFGMAGLSPILSCG